MPTLDSFQMLGKLIESVKNQSYKNWRLTFIDGPSIKEHKSYLKKICDNDDRFSFVEQTKNRKYIFGAMNQGFKLAKLDEWILFLGSDDWIASKEVFHSIDKRLNNYLKKNTMPDLLLGEATYANYINNNLGRKSKYLEFLNFRLSMFLGASLPHQATLIGPKARKKINFYDEEITLSADLDYFLKLSIKKDTKIFNINENFVFIGQGGVSGRNVLERIKQVLICYYNSYKLLFFIPFLLRYNFRVFDFVKKFFRRLI